MPSDTSNYKQAFMCKRLKSCTPLILVLFLLSASFACRASEIGLVEEVKESIHEPSSSSYSGKAAFVSGEIIIKFSPAASIAIEQARDSQTIPLIGIESLDAVFSSFNVIAINRVYPKLPNESADTFGLSRTYILRYESAKGVENLAAQLEADPEVEYAEPNFIATVQQTGGIDQ